MTTRAALIAEATARLSAAGVPDAPRDARLLMRWAAGLDGAGMAASVSETSPAAERARFAEGVARRADRAPLSHIVGQREFWGRSFHVTADVLDPRPETEALVAEALRLGPFARILDLGTGSGCILLTLVAAWPETTGHGTDISAAALRVAEGNAAKLGVAGRVVLTPGDWWAAAEGRYDLIVANPPYIAAAELAALAPEVRSHEPLQALSPGPDALAAYRAIAAGASGYLAPDGFLLVEIGSTQGEAVAAIFTDAGLSVEGIISDLDGRPRVVAARLRRNEQFFGFTP